MKIKYSKDGETFREIECDTNDVNLPPHECGGL